MTDDELMAKRLTDFQLAQLTPGQKEQAARDLAVALADEQLARQNADSVLKVEPPVEVPVEPVEVPVEPVAPVEAPVTPVV